MGTRWIPPTRGDVALVLFLVVLELTSFGQDPGLSVGDHAVALLLPLALLVRRTAPAAAAVAFLIGTACAALLHLHSINSAAAVVGIVVAAYSAGAYLPLWSATGTLVLWGAAVTVQGVVDHSDPGDIVFAAIVFICAAAPGVLVRRGREQAETARGELERSAGREAALAEQAVVDERARIARELHDVVAHAVSIMVVQAAAADEVLDRDPARAHTALRRPADRPVGHRGAGPDAGAPARRGRCRHAAAHARAPARPAGRGQGVRGRRRSRCRTSPGRRCLPRWSSARTAWSRKH